MNLKYIVKRIAHSIGVVLGVVTIIFVIVHLIGDPTISLLPLEATDEDRQVLLKELGLDRPLAVQYVSFIQQAIQGRFGKSFVHERPAFKLVLEHMPATIELTAAATLFSILIGIPLGILCSIRPGSIIDRTAMSFSLFGQAAPVFWVGIMAMMLFGGYWKLLPISGRGSFAQLILPAATLGLFAAAAITRLTRSSMLDVLEMEYIRTARTKGLAEIFVILNHAFRNALIPVVTIVALQLGMMLSGAVITETIFAWPGVGRLAVNAIYNRDFPVVEASVFVTSVFFVIINLFVDIIYTWIDPRISYK